MTNAYRKVVNFVSYCFSKKKLLVVTFSIRLFDVMEEWLFAVDEEARTYICTSYVRARWEVRDELSFFKVLPSFPSSGRAHCFLLLGSLSRSGRPSRLASPSFCLLAEISFLHPSQLETNSQQNDELKFNEKFLCSYCVLVFQHGIFLTFPLSPALSR